MAKIEDCPGFETFGEDVRAAREALGLTIKALAEQVYVDPRYLSRNRIEAYHSKHPCHAAVGTDLPSADRTLFQP